MNRLFKAGDIIRYDQDSVSYHFLILGFEGVCYKYLILEKGAASQYQANALERMTALVA